MSWQTVKLSNVCFVKRGTTITEKQAVAGNIPVVAGGITNSYTHNIANRKGNVITVSGSGANAGYVNFWECPIFASDCSTVETNSTNVDIKYIFHFLQSKQNYINLLRAGAAQPHVYAKDIALLDLLLPPLAQQKRIAAILDKADEIKRKREQAIAKLDQLAQSIFVEMFSSADMSKWDETTVEFCAENEKGSIRTGPFGSDLLHSEFTDKGVAVLGIDNAVKNRFEWAQPRFISLEKYKQLKRYTVNAGDVLITIMGTCGRCAVVPDEISIAINTKHLCCITLDKQKCLPSFLHAYFLMHPIARQYLVQTARGAIMDGLNMRIIKDMPVILPPVHLQRKYENFIKQVNCLKEKKQSSLFKQTQLFASLQNQAFTGQL